VTGSQANSGGLHNGSGAAPTGRPLGAAGGQPVGVRGAPAADVQLALEASAPAVRRYVFGMCGDWDRAEDIAQESLLKAWRGLAGFDGRASVQTWLFTIARHCWQDGLRRAGPGGNESMEQLQRMPADPGGEPPRVAQRHELAEAVAAAMQTLPAEQREALALRESGGLTFLQIAAMLDVPAATVKSRVRYALLKLADRLGPFSPAAEQER
jgi:RNA polymerase sigma-70 factor, ECF subfamily